MMDIAFNDQMTGASSINCDIVSLMQVTCILLGTY